MNVLSKLSTKVPLLGNRVTESYLEVGYNKCDNPECKYWNSVQPAMGRYNCKGFIPKPDIESESKRRRDTASSEPEVSKWSDDSDDEVSPKQRCSGTYMVSAKQAYFASHLFCPAGSEHRIRARASFKRDKAARKAAREARSKAAKLAKEVEKEFKRDLVESEVRKKKEWLEDLRKERERWFAKAEGKGEEKQAALQPTQPVKRLKRETRRLPVTMKKPVSGDIADSESSSIETHADTDETDSIPQTPPPSVPSTPNLRRRDTPPRPRPKGIVWDEPSITPPRAQYPLISRSPNKPTSSPTTSANASTSSLPDISSLSPLFARHKNRNARSAPGLSAAYARSYGGHKPQRVSYKNGVVITHFGTLMPTTRVDVKNGQKKSQPKAKAVGRRWQGQKRYLVLSKVDVL